MTYRVIRDGTRIGEYRFTVEDLAGQRKLTAEMTVKVKVFFIPIYRATHQRQEIWEAGRLVSAQGTSRYNGSDYDLSFTRTDGRGLLRVNETTQAVDDPVVTLVPWRPPVAGAATLLTEKGRTEAVTIASDGREAMQIAGQSVETEKFRLAGRKLREVWYDPAGVLVKIRYEDHGSMIQILRDGVDAAP